MKEALPDVDGNKYQFELLYHGTQPNDKLRVDKLQIDMAHNGGTPGGAILDSLLSCCWIMHFYHDLFVRIYGKYAH